MNDFDSAFDESSTGQGAPATVTTAAPAASAPAPAPAPAPAAPAADGKTDEQSTAAPAASPAPAFAPANDDAADPVKLQQKLSTLQGMLAKSGEDLKAERAARLAAEEKAAKAPAPAPAPAPATTAADAEDAELLEELESSSPVLAKALKLMMKRERVSLETALADKYGKTIDEVRSEIKPLKETAATQEVKEHLATIESAHPNWQKVVATPDFQSWVQAQPAFVQREMARVSKEGTADEVIDVLASYRKDHPATEVVDDGGKPNGNETATSKRELQRQAMSSVPTRAAPVSTAGANKNDFDAGFEAASAAATQ